MPANKFATIRYHVIDKMLRNKYKPYPSVEDIIEKCSEVLLKPISLSSIEKDIRAMKNDEALGYFAPIGFSRTHKGYFYTDEEYSIDSVPLNDDEIEAVKFATNILTQFKNIAIFKDYENAIEKVLDKVNLTEMNPKKAEDYIQFENTPTVKGNEFLAPILSAIRQSRIVVFEYRSFKSDETKSREVEPYLLKEYKNRWYLVAVEKGTKIFKVFGLERMKEVGVNPETFKKLKSFNPTKFFKYSVGITTKPQEEPVLVKFECNSVLVQYLETQPIHSSQKVEKSSQGGVVSLEVIVTFELEQLLLGFGNEVKVLEPKSLIDSLILKHQEAINKYK